ILLCPHMRDTRAVRVISSIQSGIREGIMREVKGKFNLLFVLAVVLLLAAVSFAFGAMAYLSFSHVSYATEGTDSETTHSFHCAGITYSGDYASAPSIPYDSVKYRGIEVTSVPAGLDIKLQDGALVNYTVTDSTGAVLGMITTADNHNLVVTDDKILKSTDILTLNVEFTFNTFNVSYELYNGTLYGDDSTLAVNRNPSQIDFSSLPALQAPSLAGYNFVGWYILVGDEKESVTDFNLGIFDENNSVTLYAEWTASSYKLTLYKDADRSEIQKECYVQFGTPLSYELPDSIPGEAGYSFSGWYYTSTNAKVAQDAAMPAGDIALYASYERTPAQAQINFVLEDGDNSVQQRFPVEKRDIQPGNYTVPAFA
ncbi:MAG: InlB B-repeat-containing protein, partial [Clostridia bacterium]|nr:InlB B-repeat-containing protein [Clostridia bacterium]